ncbi:MAG: ethanolamine ammonia-lyase subunit EutC, partial [Mucilaginibacter polytrichastri]|nr:ethanolamine ammonia-lyase subunit EutC [Mucilaginibacter polytrichastri]
SGTSIPLNETLKLKLAHAHARDAIFSEVDKENLRVKTAGFGLPVVDVYSCAGNRTTYLQNPEAGRKLTPESAAELQNFTAKNSIVMVIADGLSALAVNEQAVPLLEFLIPALQKNGHKISCIALAEQGRVALADEIGAITEADLSIMLIGERPGLSSADSLGAYLTYQPKPGLTDDSRNCVSNIRPQGLPLRIAAEKIAHLVNEACRLKLSGVKLKDNHTPGTSLHDQTFC